MDAFVQKRQRILDKKSFSHFKTTLSNTNYIGPQLAKNIDSEEYFKILKYWLYSDAINDFSGKESTGLYQTLRIASKKNKCSVLTFNYDDVFEQLAMSQFSGTEWTTIYSRINEAKAKSKKDHIIFHLHGYLPREEILTQKLKDSIVLSSMEYMQAYRNGKTFCYSNLIKQLHTTNLIVGNSISDYEEQKVFKQNIDNWPCEYQFMLTKKNDETWMDRCQTIFLIQMGVIPVYFKEFDEMNRYLQQL